MCDLGACPEQRYPGALPSRLSATLQEPVDADTAEAPWPDDVDGGDPQHDALMPDAGAGSQGPLDWDDDEELLAMQHDEMVRAGCVSHGQAGLAAPGAGAAGWPGSRLGLVLPGGSLQLTASLLEACLGCCTQC